MAGGAGCVVNAVQAVLGALVADAGGALTEICVFDKAGRGAAVPVSSISVVAGLVPPGHAISANLKALVVT